MTVSVTTVMLMALFLQAQPSQRGETVAPQPVHWAVKAAPGRPMAQGAHFQVELEAKIDPGWHLYALQEPAGGPIATEIALPTAAAADLLRVDQGKPRQSIDPLSHLLTSYFEGNTTFTLRLQANRAAGTGPQHLHVSVRYQTCSDRECLPPVNQPLDIPVLIQP